MARKSNPTALPAERVLRARPSWQVSCASCTRRRCSRSSQRYNRLLEILLVLDSNTLVTVHEFLPQFSGSRIAGGVFPKEKQVTPLKLPNRGSIWEKSAQSSFTQIFFIFFLTTVNAELLLPPMSLA